MVSRWWEADRPDWPTRLAVSRRSTRFGVAGIVAGQVVSTGCSAAGLVVPLARPWTDVVWGMFFINCKSGSGASLGALRSHV